MTAVFPAASASEEKASFRRAMGVMQRAVRSQKGPDETVRLTVLAEWGRAASALRGKWLDTLVYEQHLGGIPAAVPTESPEEVLSAFFYGDHLHWDRAADRRASWAEDPVFDAYYQFHFLGAVAALGWHYVEFGALVEIGSGW